MTGGRRGLALAFAAVAAIALGLVYWVARTGAPQAVERLAGPVAPPAPPPPPPWTAPQLQALVRAVDGAADEGLRPADYDRAALADARPGPDTDAIATKAALALAHDYAAGRIVHRRRFNWYIGHAGPDAATLAVQMQDARAADRLGPWLDGLLPHDPQYRALRTALDADNGAERRDRIRANMERWRWLPRDFGQGDELYVNLPTYRLEVRHDGRTIDGYNAVIGATDMPTPVLSAMVRQVIVNPSWIVPPSIVRKSKLKPGGRYSFTTLPNGTVRVRQKPGAGNALGKVKIELPNAMAIYFHDTPSRSLFGEAMRAFSHGCIRVQHIDRLGAYLTGGSPRFADAYAGDATRSFPIGKPWRADIVYLTMVSHGGGAPVELGDPYRLDAAMAAALDGRKLKTPPAEAPAVAKPPVKIAPAEPPRADPDLPASANEVSNAV